MEKLGNMRVNLLVDIISTLDNSIIENYSKNEHRGWIVAEKSPSHRTIPEGFDLCRR